MLTIHGVPLSVHATRSRTRTRSVSISRRNSPRRRSCRAIQRTTAAHCGSTPTPAAPSSDMSYIFQTIVRPNIRQEPTDKAVIDDVLNNVQPKILNYIESQITGKFLVGDAMTIADIAIVSNFIVYHYIGYKLDAAKYPKLVKYIKSIAATDAYRKALDDEKPFVADMGLDRSFLDQS
jgi:glutathione S-transferase